MDREELLREFLKLPRNERAHIAATLLASLDDKLTDDPQELEKAWAPEIERRARRVPASEPSENASDRWRGSIDLPEGVDEFVDGLRGNH